MEQAADIGSAGTARSPSRATADGQRASCSCALPAVQMSCSPGLRVPSFYEEVQVTTEKNRTVSYSKSPEELLFAKTKAQLLTGSISFFPSTVTYSLGIAIPSSFFHTEWPTKLLYNSHSQRPACGLWPILSIRTGNSSSLRRALGITNAYYFIT